MTSKIVALPALVGIGIGVGALWMPRRLSSGYGLPASDSLDDAYVRALGARDLTIGLVIAALLASDASRGLLATTVGICALTAAADFIIVATAKGANRKALPLHASGTFVLTALWRNLSSGSETP